jgi:diacylglycerol O-acyltransferase / wax synthase
MEALHPAVRPLPRSLPLSMPMRAADLAFLNALGDKQLPTGFLLDFTGEPPALDSLRRRVAERARHLPVLHYRIARDRRTLRRVDRIDTADHVRELELPTDEDGSRAGREMLARLLPADGRPPWDVWLIHRPAGGYTLCYRVDHILQDGTSAAHTTRALLDDAPRGGPAPHLRSWPSAGGIAGTLGDLANAYRTPGPRPAFSASATGLTDIRHADAPMARLRDIGRTFGGTVNDVYLAAFARAIHLWHGESTGASSRSTGAGTGASPGAGFGSGGAHPPLPVAVPMSVRGPGDEYTPGNQLVTARLMLPCDEASPVRALSRVVAQTSRLRRTKQRDGARLLLAASPRAIGARVAMRMSNVAVVPAATSNMNFGGALVHQGAAAVNAAMFTDLAAGVLCYSALTGYHDNARLTVVHDRALPTAHRLPDLWLAALLELDRARPARGRANR